jgi:epoxyqueuosine reductase QueG
MMNRYCDVRIYGPDCSYCGNNFDYIHTIMVVNPHVPYTGNKVYGCTKCQIGCGALARFKNPNCPDIEAQYNYAEMLCAEHYDEVLDANKNFSSQKS